MFQVTIVFFDNEKESHRQKAYFMRVPIAGDCLLLADQSYFVNEITLIDLTSNYTPDMVAAVVKVSLINIY